MVGLEKWKEPVEFVNPGNVPVFQLLVKNKVTPNSKMNQLYVPFSKLAVDAVFKILDKEKSVNKYGETLVIYLEQNPADHNYGSDVMIKTNAPNCLKEKIAEDTEIDEYIISKGKVKGKKSIKVLYLKSDSNSYHCGFHMKQISKLWKMI